MVWGISFLYFSKDRKNPQGFIIIDTLRIKKEIDARNKGEKMDAYYKLYSTEQLLHILTKTKYNVTDSTTNFKGVVKYYHTLHPYEKSRDRGIRFRYYCSQGNIK